MREMKDSGIPWIGKIPKTWEIVPFGIFLDNIPNSIVDGPFGSDMKNDEYVDEGVPIIQLGAIRDHGMNFTNMHYITEEKADSLIRHNAYPNDIVIAKMMPAGKACEIPDKFSRYVVSADVIKATISNKYLRKFLVYAFNAYCITQAQYESQGSTRARVNIHKVKRFKIAKPVYLESKLIVDYLDAKCARIDFIRKNVEAEIEELKQYKQSVITEAVTKGLDKNVEMKDSGIPWIGKIPSSWEIMCGKYLFSNAKEIVGTKVNDYERLALTLHGVIKRSKNDTEGLQPEDFNTYQILRKNELVFKLIDLQNISTSRVGLSPYDGIVSPAYIVLKTKENVIPSFAEKYYLMMWMNQIFNALGDAGVRSSLNVYELLEIKVPVPSIFEQHRIADYLDAKCARIDSIIQKKQKLLTNLDTYKKSLIYEYVTGKKEVPAV